MGNITSSLFLIPALAAINHVLDQADWAKRRLQPFAGRSVHIAMPPFSLSFEIDGAGRLQTGTTAPDLDISVSVDAALSALQGSDPVMKAARISGPADLADALSFVLRHLRWDIEEDLSKVFGDIAARRISLALHAVVAWQQTAARNLAGNFGEYLTEETPMLTASPELAAFADDVARLHSKLVTIETLIRRLQEKSS